MRAEKANINAVTEGIIGDIRNEYRVNMYGDPISTTYSIASAVDDIGGVYVTVTEERSGLTKDNYFYSIEVTDDLNERGTFYKDAELSEIRLTEALNEIADYAISLYIKSPAKVS